MIAVPTDGGGVTVTGLAPVPVLPARGAQARSRARRPGGTRRPGRDRRRVRRQGGVPVGHRAARGAPRAQGPATGPHDLRPPRGHRGHDQAPPGDRPPPHRRDPRRHARRPGHRGRHGRRRVLHADAGRPLARGAPLPAARTAARTCASGPGRRARTRRPTARSAASGLRRPSSRPRPTSTGSPSSSGISPLDIRRRNVYTPGDTTPTGQVLRDSVAGEEVLERAAEAAEFGHMRARTGAARRARAGSGTVPGSALRTERDRTASGIGLALAWHGAGFTGSGEVKLASVASLELTAEGRVRILTASTEMGQGTKTIFPQLVGDALGIAEADVEIAPQDTAYVPDSGPTVASRTAMVVGGLLIKAAQRLRADVETATGGPFADDRRGLCPGQRRDPHRPAVRAVPGRHPVRRRDVHRRCLPGVRLGRVRRAGRRRSRHRRGPRPRRRRGRRHRARHPPGPGRGPGRGRHAAGRRLRHDRGDQAARRALPERPARDLHHPDRARRPADLDDPRRGPVRWRAPRRQGGRGAADGRRGAGGRRRHRRCDRCLDHGPAGQPGADPGGPRRSPGRGRAAACRVGARPASAPRDDLRLLSQRDGGRGRRARHAPAARRPARGSRPDRDEGGLRGRGVRRLHGPRRRRARRFVPRADLPGRPARRSGRSRALRPRPQPRASRAAPRRPRPRRRCSVRSS